MHPATRLPPYQVAILMYPQMLTSSVTLPLEMLHTGYAFALRHNQQTTPLIMNLVSADGKQIDTQNGLTFYAKSACAELDTLDLLILPSLWRNPRPILRQQQALISWLATLPTKHPNVSIIGVGTGNCFLAEAGLLDGKPATTHWYYSQQFRHDYPQVQFKSEYFITQAENLYSVASLNALADVMVHIIETVYGQASALHVQRNFSHEIRKPYEQQRYLADANERHPDELIAQIQFYMQSNLNILQTQAQLSEQFALSPRSLHRRFCLATGKSPSIYWQTLRMQAARELLAQTNLNVHEIALEVGYASQSLFTQLFKKHFKQTPSGYRQLVRKKLFSS